MNIGQNIKIYREALGITLQNFADRVKIPTERLRRIESGKESICDFLLLYRICESLDSGHGGMRLEELLEVDGKPKLLPMDLPNYVREYIFEQRKKRGLTTQQLADKLGISRPTMERVFSGKYGNPRPWVLQNILTYFGIKASDLNNYYLSRKKQGAPVEDVHEEVVQEEKKQEVNLMESLYSLDDIVKLSSAVRIYKNVDTCIGQIDAVIKSLEFVKKILKGEQTGN